jgi:hypothetical protein
MIVFQYRHVGSVVLTHDSRDLRAVAASSGEAISMNTKPLFLSFLCIDISMSITLPYFSNNDLISSGVDVHGTF